MAKTESSKPGDSGWTFQKDISSTHYRRKQRGYLFIPVMSAVIKMLSWLDEPVSPGVFLIPCDSGVCPRRAWPLLKK